MRRDNSTIADIDSDYIFEANWRWREQDNKFNVNQMVDLRDYV